MKGMMAFRKNLFDKGAEDMPVDFWEIIQVLENFEKEESDD